MTTATKDKAPVETAVNWQEAFQLIPLEHQDAIYAYETALRTFEKDSLSLDTLIERTMQVLRSVGLTVYQSIETEHALKAAIHAGWIQNPPCQVAQMSMNGTGRKTTEYLFDGVSVKKLHPGKVRWYGARIIEAYQKAVEYPDPNS